MDEELSSGGSDSGADSGPSMDETIASSWNEIKTRMEPPNELVRDTTGKFSSTEANETAPDTETTEALAAESTSPVVKKSAPAGWKPEAKAAWDALPPHVQDDVLRREDDFHKGIEGYKQHADIGRRMEAAYRPFEATMRTLGVSPEVAVGELLKADHQMRFSTPENKGAFVAKLIRDYGIDPNHVFGHFQEQAQQHEDPGVQKLYSELADMKAWRGQFEQQEQSRLRANEESELAALNSEVAKFTVGKEHFDVVQAEMTALLPALRAANPAAGVQEVLQMAYDRAIYANPQTRAALLAKQQEDLKAEAAKKAKLARSSASVNVASRGTIESAAPKMTMDQQIRADAQRLGLL